jgi:hypothetical protein
VRFASFPLTLMLVVTASCASAPRPTPAGAPVARPKPQPAVDPDLDPAQVASIVSSHLVAVKTCYERELKKKPGLAGKVVTHWTIEVTGATSSIFTESDDLRESAVPACIEGLIATWLFPRPTKPVDVSFPFVFKTSDENADAPSAAPPEPGKTSI